MTHLTRRSAIGLAMAALPLAAACADPMTDIDTDKDQVFRVADTDKDKLLDKNEYMALVEKRFKAADTDHDGKIDATELKTPAGQSLQKTSLLSRARLAGGEGVCLTPCLARATSHIHCPSYFLLTRL